MKKLLAKFFYWLADVIGPTSIIESDQQQLFRIRKPGDYYVLEKLDPNGKSWKALDSAYNEASAIEKMGRFCPNSSVVSSYSYDPITGAITKL